MKKRVITYGTFDLLHVGHIELLRRTRKLGDYLIVGVSTDEFNSLKNKRAFYPFEERKRILEAIKYVDLVIPESSWDQKTRDIIRHKVDLFVIGDDWKGQFDYIRDYCEVIYLPRTVGISTTKIKTRIKREGQQLAYEA